MNINYKIINIEILNECNLGFTLHSTYGSCSLVKSVDPSGLAWKAGIEPDDYILMINGKQIRDMNDISIIKEPKLNIMLNRFNKDISLKPERINEINDIICRRYSKDSAIVHRESCKPNSRKSSLHSKCDIDVNIVRNQATRKISYDISHSRLRKEHKNSFHKLNDFKEFVPSNIRTGLTVPTRMSNLSGAFSASVQNLSNLNNPGIDQNDIETQRVVSHSNLVLDYTDPSINAEKSTSTFVKNAPIADYIVDWTAIYAKISPKIKNKIEIELVSYFRNSNIDLKRYPSNFLYRFITFDEVLETMFQNILASDCQVSFEEQLLKNGSNMNYSDYDLNEYDIEKIIRSNIKKTKEMIEEYDVKKQELGENQENLKESLDQYLKKPKSWTPEKVHKEIDGICKKLLNLIEFLVTMATSMSRWKLSKDLPDLCSAKHETNSLLSSWKNGFDDFKDSERKIMKQVLVLLQQFREDSGSEVLNIFDHLFSENMEISICLSILHVKYELDIKMEDVLKRLTPTAARFEQFV